MIKVNSSLRGLLFYPVIFFSILFFVSCHEEINDVSPGTGSLLEEVIKKYSVQEITTQFGGGQADLLPLGMEASWEKAYEDNGVIIVPVRDSILSLCHAVGYYIFSRPHTAIVVKSLIYFNQGDTLIQCTNDTLINPFQNSFEGMIWELGQGDYILGMYEIMSGQLTRSLRTQTHMDDFVEFLNVRSGSATTRSCDRCWGESWWDWFWHCFNVRLDVMEGGVADFFESLWNSLSDADRRQFPGYDPNNPGSSFFGFIDFISGGGVASGGGGNGGSGVPRYLGAEYDAFMSDCQSWIAWKVAAEQEGLPPGVSESDWKLCELFSDQTLGLHHFIKLCVFKNGDILSVVNDYWEQSAKDAESAALIKRYLEQVCLSDYPISLNQWLKYEVIRNRILNSSCIVDKTGFLSKAEAFLDIFQYSDEALAAWDFHTEFQCPDYSDYQSQVGDLLAFTRQKSLDQYLAGATLYYEYMTQVGDPPADLYKWQLMMEVFIEELGPLALELIPGGVGDLIGAYNDYNAGNYWSASLGIVLAVVPFNEIKKVWTNAPTIRRGFKSCYKVVVLWNKLLTTPGGQKVLSKMPKVWKDLPGSKLGIKESGLVWVKSDFHELRLMEKNISSPEPFHQYDYIRLKKNGKFLGKNGNYYQKGSIPNDEFQMLTHIPIDQIENEWLDNFFN